VAVDQRSQAILQFAMHVQTIIHFTSWRKKKSLKTKKQNHSSAYLILLIIKWANSKQNIHTNVQPFVCPYAYRKKNELEYFEGW